MTSPANKEKFSLRFPPGLGLALALSCFAGSIPAFALDLDWSGQFRAEAQIIKNYSGHGNGLIDPSRMNLDANNKPIDPKGYYVPGGGSDTAQFQSLFLKVKPKVIVNDNVYIKSEWWLGDPVYGFFGSAAPYTSDQTQFYSTQSRGSTITAQRFWGEFLSDVGTFQVGRAPLHWGLGLFWNSGDGIWDRYESTGDVVRLISKFGAFSFSPALVKYYTGNTIGGGSWNPTTGLSQLGGGGLSDYSLGLKYENVDEDFEGGLNFIRRIAGGSQSKYVTFNQPGGGMNFNIWDIYGRKKIGIFTLGGEAPIISGNIGGARYSTIAVALEAKAKYNETWETDLKGGHAPGQPNLLGGTTPDSFKAFYFNPNYRLGLIMFNYQLANFAGPNTQNDPSVGANQLKSPYDNPIVNANYLSVDQLLNTGKWTHHLGFIWAKAPQTAKAGQTFYNTWTRKFEANAAKDQSDSLGWELDLGTNLKWDDNFQFRFDTGLFFPGDYYKFSNTGTDNGTATVWATLFGVSAAF